MECTEADMRQAESILLDIYRAQTSVVIPKGSYRRKYAEQLEEKRLIKQDKQGFFEITDEGKKYIRRQ